MSEDSANKKQGALSSAEIGEIASAVAPVKPSEQRASAMKSRILEGIHKQDLDADAHTDVQAVVKPEHQNITQTNPVDTLKTVSVASRKWSSYSPGVEVCTLYDDGQRRSALLKMSPGSFLFPHRHQQIEESIVLEGSAVIGEDIEIDVGDYQFADAGSEHPIISSPQGCIVLVHGESKPKVKLTIGLFTRLARHYFARARE